jgi:hypothetical protein
VNIEFTMFPDITGRAGKFIQTTFGRFVDRLATLPRQPVKARSPLITFAVFGDRRTDRGSLRTDRNVLAVTGASGDYDAGHVSPREAVERLERHGLRCVVATTWSHEPDAPRWRVFAPTLGRVGPADHRRLVAGVNGALGGVLGEESFTLSRGYYIGGPPEGEYLVLPTFGDPSRGVWIDQWPELDQVAVYPPEPERPFRAPRPAPADIGDRYVFAAIRSECDTLARTPEGERNRQLNRSAFSLARFVADGKADAAMIARELAHAAAQAGLGARETEKTLKSAFRARGAA